MADPTIEKRKSFVSEEANAGYGLLITRLANESKKQESSENTIVCAISLETPFELKQYFSWIAIPSGNKLPPKIYSVIGLKTYLDASDNQGNPDPNRILGSLRHMTTRVNRYLALPENIKSISATDISFEMKTKLLKELLNTWAEGKRDDHLEKMGVIFSFGLWFDLGYVHCLDKDQTEALLIKSGSKPKSFIIRKSSFSSENGHCDCTVFTISHVLDDGFIWHVRILDVHGVGLYCVTYTHEQKIMSYGTGNTLATNDMRIILNKLNYAPPTYACFTDLLIDFSDKGYIDLSSFTCTADQNQP